MNAKKIVEIDYSFDHLEIMGVFGDDVYLKGTYDIKQDCIIKISRSLFEKSLGYWLNDKKSYCEDWGHFCGIMGSIQSIDYEEIDNNFESTGLKVYKINTIEKDTDMEHG